MSGNLGSLSVDLLLNAAAWVTGLNKSEQEAKKFEASMTRSFDKIGDSLGGMVKGYATMATAALGLAEIIHATAEAEEATARLEVAVNNLAVGTGITTEKISAFADEMAKVTQFDDEGFRNAAANILRFGGVTEQVLMRTTQAAADFAAMTGQDLASAAATLGKAVTEPAQGMQRLERQIGYIDESTKKYIKTLAESGETIKAQNALLDVLEQRTGGAAEKMNGTLAGALANSKKGFSDVAEAIGNITIVHDVVESFFTFLVGSLRELTDIINKGEITQFFAFMLGFRQEMAKPVKPAAVPKDAAAIAKQEAEASLKFKADLDEQDEKLIAVAKKRQEKYAADRKKIAEDLADALKKAQDMEDEARALGNKYQLEDDKKTAKEKLEIDKQVFDAEAAMEKIAQEARDEENKFRIREAKKNAEELEAQYGGMFKGIEDAGRAAFDSIFDKTAGGWQGMLDTMAKAFKRTLVDMVYQQFAKPLMLQVMAQMGGGVGQYAAGELSKIPGGGSGFDLSDMTGAATKAYDYFFGSGPNTLAGDWSWTANTYGAVGAGVAGILGGAVGKWGAGAMGAGQRGVQAGQQWGTGLATVGMMTFGPVGAAIGAALGAIIGKYTDPDPDAMRAARFGGASSLNAPGQSVSSLWRGKAAFGEFGFSSGEWLSDSDMGDTVKKFLEGIGKMDDALAAFMSPTQIADVTKRLDEASKRYELGMEHGGVTNLADIMKDRLAVITKEISAGLGAFVEAFDGPIEEIISIVDSYLSATTMAKGFGDALAATSEKPKSGMEAYQATTGQLTEFIAGMDTSAASMAILTQGMTAFGEATLVMIANIDAAAASMHDAFMTTAEQITRDLLNPEELYARIQAQTDEMYAALSTETDPAKIQALAEKINSNINEAWNMLDETQQGELGEEYLARISALDKTVADKMKALREVVVEDAEDVMEKVVVKLDALFARGEVAAATQQAAADTNLQAANTPVVVIVDGPGAVNGG